MESIGRPITPPDTQSQPSIQAQNGSILIEVPPGPQALELAHVILKRIEQGTLSQVELVMKLRDILDYQNLEKLANKKKIEALEKQVEVNTKPRFKKNYGTSRFIEPEDIERIKAAEKTKMGVIKARINQRTQKKVGSRALNSTVCYSNYY